MIVAADLSRGAAAWARRAVLGVVKPVLSWVPRRVSGEHEIVLNRVAASVLILVYTLWNESAGDGAIALAMVYATFGVVSLIHLRLQPEREVFRRSVGMVLDLGLLSYGLHIGGGATAILYPFYLWIIFGNGFRFGVPALAASAGAAIVGFGTTIYTTPFWQENLQLALGLLSALVVLPAYAATLLEKLSRAVRAAEQASRAKSLFLASVSHELRTPLNAVIGMTELLEGTELDGEQRDMARTAGDSGRALLGLIDDLLKFSRLEVGRMPVQNAPFDLHKLLVEARGMLISPARAKNLRLALHVTSSTPALLVGDGRQIRDILVNLLGNAVKFTESGGVVVGVGVVSRADRRVRLRFEVSDTGIGIASDARARIFDSFTQADETIVNSYGGTGLGLAICRQSVQLMGGDIGVDSDPGAGSTFWFELDLDMAEPANVDMHERPRVVALAATDERAEALVRALEAAGALAIGAVGVRQALVALRSGDADGAPRVVVVDGHGAVPNGEALISALRAASDDDVETVLIDAALDDGLPDVELRFATSAVLRSADEPSALSAAVRIARLSAPSARNSLRARESLKAVRRLKILVAEDNRTNQKVITKVLERAGHEVRLAGNGELALDALTERAFDLVLMDINMPVLDGIECTKLYRFASIGKPRTPIVALTADATPEVKTRCEEAGMDGCLTKPIEPDRLIAIINDLIPLDPAAGAGEPPAGIDEVDDEIVARISNHPGFRPAKRAVVDQRTLTELEELGGRDFLKDLIEEFIGDTAIVLRSLHEAVEAGEASVFREQAHALRSGSANIGARGMYEICLSFRNMDVRALAEHGEQHVRQLEQEFDRVAKTLRRQSPGVGIRSSAD